jgi:hypothetical protein
MSPQELENSKEIQKMGDKRGIQVLERSKGIQEVGEKRGF